MSKRDKLIKRLKSRPRDFTWEEAVSLMNGFNFKEIPNSGSRRKFFNESKNLHASLHKPHPGNVLKAYAVDYLIDFLSDNGFI